MEKKKILLVTSGQPALNPRLVKEADAMADAGYDVTVLYSYWNAWGTEIDNGLLPKNKWKAVRVGGVPGGKIFLQSRLIHKIAWMIFNKTKSNYFADFAIARSSYFLIREAKRFKADLYIAHNLGALPAVVKAAEKYQKPCGFDAEDFHRNEISDDPNDPDVILKTNIEQRYIPRLDYWTASSPLIAEEYHRLFPSMAKPEVILNVFPLNKEVSPGGADPVKPLKLFWFSQTIGTGRGLEDILSALKMTGLENVELNLLGHLSEDAKHMFADSDAHIVFHNPIPPDEIPAFASQFDIGLAIETRSPHNRNICLTNKIFTYLSSGLAVVASNTIAQQQLLARYPGIGKVYPGGNAEALAELLRYYQHDRDVLHQTKLSALQAAKNELNWETESKKFFAVIERTFGKVE